MTGTEIVTDSVESSCFANEGRWSLKRVVVFEERPVALGNRSRSLKKVCEAALLAKDKRMTWVSRT